MEAAKQYGAFAVAAVLVLVALTAGEFAIAAWLAAAWFGTLGIAGRSTRWGLAATAALAFACSIYLFWRKLDAAGSSICNVNAAFDCDVVNTSAASMLFGIPVALLGAGYYLGVFAAAATTSKPEHRLYQTTGLTSLVGLAVCVYLFVEATKLPSWCLMCLTMYACTASLFGISLMGVAEEHTPLLVDVPEAARSSSGLIVGGTFLAVTAVGQWMYVNQEPPPAGAPAASGAPAIADPARQLQSMYVRPTIPVQLEGDEPVLGDPNAPYTVVEYACFGCPHCAESLGHIKELVVKDPQIQVMFRSFPLTGECNPGIGRGGYPEKCRAAMAAQCANRQKQFWPYATYLFDHQSQLGEALLSEAATAVSLDFAAFSACMSDPEILAQVERDATSGLALQIPGTPALFLKGVLPDGQWVEVCGGAEAVQLLVDAHQAGMALLPAPSAECPN